MVETLSTSRAHGGTQGVYRHDSVATSTPMTFSAYVPAQAAHGRCPVVYFLSGLTCTHGNVTDKGEYRRVCAELGLIFVAPDTSPRGEGVPDDAQKDYDFGLGASFYLDATQAPFSQHYQMARYVVEELPLLVQKHFAADPQRRSIAGHSMGGHGALTLGLKHPERYRAVSAFAPIVAPSQVPWGRKALAGYLGTDPSVWRQHDAVALIEGGAKGVDLLVDQGTQDAFLSEQLQPERLVTACKRSGLPLELRMQKGYDHSYHFISTFMESHLRWHDERLRR